MAGLNLDQPHIAFLFMAACAWKNKTQTLDPKGAARDAALGIQDHGRLLCLILSLSTVLPR
ncbi:MAG: hypothetical protein K0R66_1758 [Gammaproteobacteria bacterium]|jgi:hypothetical protein|nr:hypothetical protein [Gammaproteobacteria bacterium]